MPPSTSSAAGLSSILRPSNGHSQLNYYGGVSNLASFHPYFSHEEKYFFHRRF